MLSQHQILLSKIIADSSPIEVLQVMAKYVNAKSFEAKSGIETHVLRGVVTILRQSVDRIVKVLENAREYHPQHRVYSDIHYSPRHAKEVFKVR